MQADLLRFSAADVRVMRVVIEAWRRAGHGNEEAEAGGHVVPSGTLDRLEERLRHVEVAAGCGPPRQEPPSA